MFFFCLPSLRRPRVILFRYPSLFLLSLSLSVHFSLSHTPSPSLTFSLSLSPLLLSFTFSGEVKVGSRVVPIPAPSSTSTRIDLNEGEEAVVEEIYDDVAHVKIVNGRVGEELSVPMSMLRLAEVKSEKV